MAEFQLRYDERNRLDRVTVGALTTTYGVNGLGERVAKDGQQAFGKVEQVYDLAGQVLGIYKSGAPLEEIVWLGALPVGTIQGGAAYSIAPDHLGAPYKIVNSSNAQVWFWDHDPFGNGAPTAAAGFSHRLRFPGQVYDAESGLHSNGQRDYDPRLGRYVESDPIGLDGGINTYAYAKNNPVNSVDPSGAIVESPYDAANVAMGLYSFFDNLFRGNYAAAGVDFLGLGVDVAATAIPGVPGGAATAIALGRGAAAALQAPASGTVQAWSGKITAGAVPEGGMTAFRIWGGESVEAGSWLSPIAPESSSAARDLLALPSGNTAEFISPVQIPAGTHIQFGTAAGAFGQTGGGTQIQLLERIPLSSFGPATRLRP
jgi:RHS repeat-associated protein